MELSFCRLAQPHMFIKKLGGDCWLEPTSGIIYEYLFLYPKDQIYRFPKHLEILPNNNEEANANQSKLLPQS